MAAAGGSWKGGTFVPASSGGVEAYGFIRNMIDFSAGLGNSPVEKYSKAVNAIRRMPERYHARLEQDVLPSLWSAVQADLNGPDFARRYS